MISHSVVLGGAFMHAHMWEGMSGGCECVLVCIYLPIWSQSRLQADHRDVGTAEQQGGYLCLSRLEQQAADTPPLQEAGEGERVCNNISFIFFHFYLTLPLPQKVAQQLC